MPDSISPTQKLISQFLVDLPVEAVKGLLGIDPSEYPSEEWIPKKTNLLLQMLTAAEPLVKAGLPFSAIMGKNNVFHGTRNAINEFDSIKHDSGDFLGWMTHFTEDPEYANEFAKGNYGRYFRGNQENIIPARIDAKNVLDLSLEDRSGSNVDDLAQAIGSLSPYSRHEAINIWKNSNPAERTTNVKRYLLNLFDKGNTPFKDAREQFKKTPFDAIRYGGSQEGWAVPDYTGIHTPAGVPLNKPGRPIQILRNEKSSGGILTEEEW